MVVAHTGVAAAAEGAGPLALALGVAVAAANRLAAAEVAGRCVSLVYASRVVEEYSLCRETMGGIAYAVV